MGDRDAMIVSTSPVEERLIRPRYYLGATHEVFGLTLLITWGLTLATPMHRSQIFDHPARAFTGSYIPCFGWYYIPASWSLVCCCSFNAYSPTDTHGLRVYGNRLFEGRAKHIGRAR